MRARLPAMLSRSHFAALFLCALVTACTSQEKLTVESPEPTSPTSAAVTISSAALQKICATEHVDDRSRIFVAKKNGVVTRFSVTPSPTMADMGNLLFDADGNHLGDDMGGELPWENKAVMAAETARVAKLMDGAEIEGGALTTSCPKPAAAP